MIYAKVNGIIIWITFTSQTFPAEALVISVSFPDVIGALAPAVTVALVNTVSTLRIAERFTLTHKTFAINNRGKAGFLPFDIMSQTNSFHFTNIAELSQFSFSEEIHCFIFVRMVEILVHSLDQAL